MNRTAHPARNDVEGKPLQACEACRIRHVKCDSDDSCQNCRVLRLQCLRATRAFQFKNQGLEAGLKLARSQPTTELRYHDETPSLIEYYHGDSPGCDRASRGEDDGPPQSLPLQRPPPISPPAVSLRNRPTPSDTHTSPGSLRTTHMSRNRLLDLAARPKLC